MADHVTASVGYLMASHGFLRAYCLLCRPGDTAQIASTGTAGIEGNREATERLRAHIREVHGLEVDTTFRDAAAFARLGGSATSARKTRAARANGARGGRPVCLATIRLDTPRQGIGRILWRPMTGEIRVAASGQSWEDAQRPEMIGSCSTLDYATEQIRQAWGVNPAWDLSLIDRR